MKNPLLTEAVWAELDRQAFPAQVSLLVVLRGIRRLTLWDRKAIRARFSLLLLASPELFGEALDLQAHYKAVSGWCSDHPSSCLRDFLETHRERGCRGACREEERVYIPTGSDSCCTFYLNGRFRGRTLNHTLPHQYLPPASILGNLAWERDREVLASAFTQGLMDSQRQWCDVLR